MAMRCPALAAPANGATEGAATALRHTLSNGIVVLLQRNPSSPIVSVRGDVQMGAVYEPAEKAGLSALTGAALIRGTQQRTFQQIMDETEMRGCSVHTGGGLHSSGFAGKSLAEDLPLILEIMRDVVVSPTFPASEVEKLRGQFLMGLRESEQETHTRAARAARALLYPAVHPYSRSVSGTPTTVQQLTRDDLVAFHQRYHPAVMSMAVVGAIDPEAVIKLLEELFGGWEPASERPRLELPPVSPIVGVQRQDIAMAGKVQSDIIWAVHGLQRIHPDYYAAMIGNVILGRLGIGGRLGSNVREEQGMAYYVQSNLEADMGAGPWVALAGVGPANVERAIESILHEIETFTQQGPTEEELADVRAYLTGSLVLGLETNGGIAGMLLSVERYGLGMDYITRYPDIINGVSYDDVVRVARTYLSTQDYVLTVAGPAAGEQA